MAQPHGGLRAGACDGPLHRDVAHLLLDRRPAIVMTDSRPRQIRKDIE